MILHLSYGPSRQCTLAGFEKVRRQVRAEGVEVQGIEVTEDERVQLLEQYQAYQLDYEKAIPGVKNLTCYGIPVTMALDAASRIHREHS